MSATIMMEVQQEHSRDIDNIANDALSPIENFPALEEFQEAIRKRGYYALPRPRTIVVTTIAETPTSRAKNGCVLDLNVQHSPITGVAAKATSAPGGQLAHLPSPNAAIAELELQTGYSAEATQSQDMTNTASELTSTKSKLTVANVPTSQIRHEDQSKQTYNVTPEPITPQDPALIISDKPKSEAESEDQLAISQDVLSSIPISNSVGKTNQASGAVEKSRDNEESANNEELASHEKSRSDEEKMTSQSLKANTRPIHFVPVAGRASKQKGKSIWGKIAAFISFTENLYWARDLSVEPVLVKQWEDVWYQMLDDRLRFLSVGSDVISLELVMAGPEATTSCMMPTVLLFCANSRKRSIEGGLVRFIPETLQLKIVGKDVKLTSAEIGTPSQPGNRTGCPVEAQYGETNPSIVGHLARTLKFLPESGEWKSFPVSTVGGIISVGSTLFAMTTAHSIFNETSSINLRAATSASKDFRAFGAIESYEWSGASSKAEVPLPKTSLGYEKIVAMDWALIRIQGVSIFPNMFKVPESESDFEHIAGFLKVEELLAGEVWVCAGITGVQLGILNSTSASIVFGQATFKVRSIALEHPLADGDSGSWIIKDHKVCGYIFSRVVGLPWAYMLPIAPVLDKISRVYSKENYIHVDVPSAAFVEVLKSLPRRNDPFQQKSGPGSTARLAQELEGSLPNSTSDNATLVITPAMQTALPGSHQGQPSKVSLEGGALSSPDFIPSNAKEELRVPTSSGELQGPGIPASVDLEGAFSTSNGAFQPPSDTLATHEISFFNHLLKPLFKWARVLGTWVSWRLSLILAMTLLFVSFCGGYIYGLYRLGSENSIPVYGRVLAIVTIVCFPSVIIICVRCMK